MSPSYQQWWSTSSFGHGFSHDGLVVLVLGLLLCWLTFHCKCVCVLNSIGRGIGGGKESPSGANFALPPVGVRSVDDGDNVASMKLKLARLLWTKVVDGLH